ncbi:hypothetical protein FB567DRAFT_612236 [Paraphoma chrysanthemicola]|uniref:Uncharacterized protein n=1 Tax=Paraphoma chrysanthemicola TaxID=798071 RepID=A0A8K0QWF6_9PLEO|nr:hypothetical protein FB567DRAFT_612236 [Paraphoma chrysanthemicola]
MANEVQMVGPERSVLQEHQGHGVARGYGGLVRAGQDVATARCWEQTIQVRGRVAHYFIHAFFALWVRMRLLGSPSAVAQQYRGLLFAGSDGLKLFGTDLEYASRGRPHMTIPTEYLAQLTQPPNKHPQREEMPLCFLRAFTESTSRSITQEAYINHLLSHFQGVRHPQDSDTRTIESLACFEPWVASLRDLALTASYEPFQGVSAYAALFKTCLEGRANKLKSDLRAMRKDKSRPDPLQPIACLAAQKAHLPIFQFCVEEGAVFDRYLNRAAQMGAKGNTAFLAYLLEQNWCGIRDSDDAVREQVMHFGEGSGEAEWLRQNAGKGVKVKGQRVENGKKKGPKQPNNKSNRDPQQGYTPEQIQEWFGDINW